jgi:hypothetical protein
LRRDPEYRLDPLSEREALAILVRERLHRADLVQRLIDVAGDVRHPVLDRARELAHARAEQADRQQHQRHAREREHGELHAGEEEHRDAAHEGNRHAQRVEQRAAHHRLDERHVVGHARGHFAGACLLVEPGREQEQMVVDAPAQVRGEARPDPVDVVDAEPREHAEERDQAREQGERLVEELLLAAREALVDHQLQALADHQHHRGRQHDRHHRDRDAGAIRQQQSEKREEPFQKNGVRLVFQPVPICILSGEGDKWGQVEKLT